MARLAVLPLLLAAAAAQTALVFSTTNFAFVGNAFQYGDLTGAVLTQATGSQGGAVWLKQTYRISTFTATFDFRISSPSSTPADGFCFVIQNIGTGPGTGSLYASFGNSVAVCIDTYRSPNIITTNLFQNGNIPQYQASNDITSAFGGSAPIGNTGSFSVSYSGTTFSWSIVYNGVTKSYTQTGVTLYSIIGASSTNPVAYVGFTAATGGSWSRQEISNFKWMPSCGSPPTSSLYTYTAVSGRTDAFTATCNAPLVGGSWLITANPATCSFISAGACVSPSSTPSVSPSTSASLSITRTRTLSSSVTTSVTPSPSVTRSVGPTVSISASVSVSASLSSTVTPSVSTTRSASVSATVSATTTRSPSMTVSPSVSPSITASGTITPSKTASSSMTPTVSASTSVSPSISASSSLTASVSLSASVTPSRTVTKTRTKSVTASRSPTSSESPSASATSSVTPTSSATPSVSPSSSVSSSVAPSPSLSPTPLNSEVLSVQYHVLMPVMFAGSMACHPDLMTTLLNATNGVLPSLRKEVMDFLNVQSVQSQIDHIVRCNGSSLPLESTSTINAVDPITGQVAAAGTRRLTIRLPPRPVINAEWRQHARQALATKCPSASSPAPATGAPTGGSGGTVGTPTSGTDYGGSMSAVVAVLVDSSAADQTITRINRYLNESHIGGGGGLARAHSSDDPCDNATSSTLATAATATGKRVFGLQFVQTLQTALTQVNPTIAQTVSVGVAVDQIQAVQPPAPPFAADVHQILTVVGLSATGLIGFAAILVGLSMCYCRQWGCGKRKVIKPRANPDFDDAIARERKAAMESAADATPMPPPETQVADAAIRAAENVLVSQRLLVLPPGSAVVVVPAPAPPAAATAPPAAAPNNVQAIRSQRAVYRSHRALNTGAPRFAARPSAVNDAGAPAAVPAPLRIAPQAPGPVAASSRMLPVAPVGVGPVPGSTRSLNMKPAVAV